MKCFYKGIPYDINRCDVPKEIVSDRKATYLGKRVKFVRCGANEPDPILPGDIGDVIWVDDLGSLIVKWQSGRSLNVLLCDEVEIVGEAPEEVKKFFGINFSKD